MREGERYTYHLGENIVDVGAIEKVLGRIVDSRFGDATVWLHPARFLSGCRLYWN